eukprot:jgi/Botrbrau1/10123/Bobra.20_2s0028.2
MQAIIYENPGGPEVLRMGTVPVPVPGPTDVLLSVKAAGVNRAEAMQREGHYPRSPRAVSNIGPRGLRHHHSGRRGCGGLESGGSSHGSSEWRRLCRTGDGGRGLQCWRYPDNWSDAEAAGFMETTLTAFLNIFQIGGAKARSTVLIHGGASGVGTQAAALCKARDITTFVTCGSSSQPGRRQRGQRPSGLCGWALSCAQPGLPGYGGPPHAHRPDGRRKSGRRFRREHCFEEARANYWLDSAKSKHPIQESAGGQPQGAIWGRNTGWAAETPLG